jgi:GNAT superfamily N-acetyltransferase
MTETQKPQLNYTIRRSAPGDYMMMREVNRAAWQLAYAHIYRPDEIHALFNDEIAQYGSWVERRLDRIATLVAEADGRIIGFCGCALLHSGDGEIVTLYIHPDYQGGGVGTGLWNAGLDVLREAGCEQAWVWVLEKAQAVHFYENKGCILAEQGLYRVGDHEEMTHGYVLELAA